MFDRPSDTWYIYMRPFRVALLLQTRNLQRTACVQEEKDEKEEKVEKEEKDKSTEIKTEPSL
jgi:hypothetical protein